MSKDTYSSLIDPSIFSEYPKRVPEMDRDYGRARAYLLQDNTLAYEHHDRDQACADEILRLKEERELLELREEVKRLRERAALSSGVGLHGHGLQGQTLGQCNNLSAAQSFAGTKRP